MIKSIEFKNYKAFKEGTLELSPLTVLMGANSVGKSSVLKLILTLSQTAGENKNSGALKSFGKLTDGGEVRNIFYQKDTTNELEICFNLELPIKASELLNDIKNKIYFSLLDRLRKNIFILHEINDNNRIDKETFNSLRKFDFNFHTNDNQIESINEIISAIKKTRKQMDENENNHSQKNIPEMISRDLNYKEIKKSEIIDSIIILDELGKFGKIKKISYKISYSKTKNLLKVSSIAVFSTSGHYIEIDFYRNKDNRRSCIIKSDKLNASFFEKHYPTINKAFDFNGMRLQWNNDHNNDEPFLGVKLSVSYILYSFMKHYSDTAIKEFNPSNIRHVSPVRAYPKRYYFLNESDDTSYFDTTDQDSLPLYINNNPDTLEKVNTWLNKFGFNVKVDSLNEMIHSIKIKQNNIKLDLIDIGFGISQILPVIIQSLLAKKGSITLIEQPEIHIHPKMQADLADFFILLAKKDNKKFIIETHSEAFLKRLRRRMAEYKTENENSISPDNVSIQFIERDKNSEKNSIIINKEISKTGDFEWPKDFMSTDIEDTIEFLKLQG
ncbi:AAA family ATPase [Thiothrix sp.]|jgi:predicted ATPase|uniref:AAA family ATPase n=1 Tax=Thiothrix sp. TaxID=1032 RepID=UPI00257CE98D|nr:AAA family ATPase [Thiothrix sp.]